MILLVLASASLLVAAALIAVQLTPRGVVASVLAFGLLAWALCVATVGVAGLLLGSLADGTLLALSLAWCAGAAVVAWRRGGIGLSDRLRGGLAAAREVLAWPPTAVACTIIALALVWRTILAVRLPVVDILGWQYHLVFVDVWLQSDAIVRVSQNRWTDGWPATGELLTTWLAAFTRTDALTGFTGLLPIPIAMVATTGLARSLGAARPTSLLAGLLFGMIPAVLAMAGTTYVDTAFTAAVIATWWLGLRIVRGERDTSAALLLGISAGLAIGIKGTSFVLVLPMLAVVGIGFVVALVDEVRTRAASLRPLAWLAAVMVPVLLLGSSWYVKNALLHGNPVYPVGLGPFEGLEAGLYGAPTVPAAIAGLGPIEQVARSWIHDWNLAAYSYNVRPGGFGHGWLAVLPLSVFGAGILARRRAWAALALVLAPALLTLALLTSPWYARYTLFIPALALPLAALALDRIGSVLRTAAALVLVALASLSVVVACAYPNNQLLVPPGGPDRALAYVNLVLSGSDEARSNSVVQARCAGADVIPPGSRVLVAQGFFLPHAIVGPNLDRVLVQPPPAARDALALLAELQAGGADWLVTRRGSELDAATTAQPEVFTPRGQICLDGNLWEVEHITAGPVQQVGYLVTGVQAKRVAVGVQECTGPLERLIFGQPRTELDSGTGGGIQVAHLEAQVHHHSLLSRLPGPHRRHVVVDRFKADVGDAFARTDRCATVLAAGHLPSQQLPIETGESQGIGGVDGGAPPVVARPPVSRWVRNDPPEHDGDASTGAVLIERSLVGRHSPCHFYGDPCSNRGSYDWSTDRCPGRATVTDGHTYTRRD